MWTKTKQSGRELRTDKELKALHQQSRRELWGSDFVIVGAAILDYWTANCQTNFDNNWNALVHGGRLHADIETIKIFTPTEPERIDRWKSAFREAYGILFDRLEPQSEHLRDIFACLNMALNGTTIE